MWRVEVVRGVESGGCEVWRVEVVRGVASGGCERCGEWRL